MSCAYSPVDLATILHLSEDGTVYSSDVDATTIHRDVQAVLEALQEATDKETTQIFMEEFHASYLPSLAATALSKGDSMLSSVCYGVYSTLSSFEGHFIRFVKLYPDTVVQLFVDSLDELVLHHRELLEQENEGTADPDLDVIHPGRQYLTSAAAHRAEIWNSLTTQLSVPIKIPPLEPSVRSGLRELAIRFRHDTHLRSYWTQSSAGLSRLIRTLEGLSMDKGSEMLRLERSVLDKRADRSWLAWWSCESTRCGSTPPGACHPIPEGQQMSACGRCATVRYCSQAHQRADWKRHKRFCFRPTW